MKKALLFYLLIIIAITGYSQITIESGGSLVVSPSSNVIAGNGIVNNGGSIDIAATGTVENQGNLENNSTALTPSSSLGTFKFNGITAQEITGDHDADFYGVVEIDNANGVSVTNTSTGSNQTINGTLVFTDGLLILNTFNLALVNDAIDAGAGKYIQTNSSGYVTRNVIADGTTDFVFPVGNSTYNPLTLQNSADASSDDYYVRVIDNEPAGSNTDHFVNRNWNITEQVADGSELTVTPQWNNPEELTDFNRGNAAVGLTTDNGSTYDWSASGEAEGSDPYSVASSTFTGVGTFTVGDSIAVDYQNINQLIDLTAGWNIASFSVTPYYIHTDSIFKSIKESSVLVKAIDETGGFIQDIPGLGWLNTIGDMENTEGYYVKVSSDYQMTARGFVPQLPFNIPLLEGWNIMGYPMIVSQDAENALQEIIDDNNLVKVIDEAGGFIQNIPGLGWLNTIGDFDPGEGYYIKVSANDTLKVDVPSARYYAKLFPVVDSKLLKLPWINNPYNPMNIIVENVSLNGIKVQEGDEIAVYDNELCVGTGAVVRYQEKLIAHIVASMDDPTTDVVDGYKSGNQIVFKHIERDFGAVTNFQPVHIYGNDYFEPLETYVGSASDSFTEVQDNILYGLNLKYYPNPTSGKLYISFVLQDKDEVQFELIDIYGNRIKLSNTSHTKTSQETAVFDMSQQKKGFYILRITIKSEDKVDFVNVKVIKK